jgi:hypothetical protein
MPQRSSCAPTDLKADAAPCQHYPLEPCLDGDLPLEVCLCRRFQEVPDLLILRGFSDTSACVGAAALLDAGLDLIWSGRAAWMTPAQRAAWAWTVAWRAAARAARKEPRFQRLGRRAESRRLNPGDAHLGWLREAVDSLPESQKEAVVLRFFLGMSIRQAAMEAGVRPSTIDNRVRAGLVNLARIIASRDLHGLA